MAGDADAAGQESGEHGVHEAAHGVRGSTPFAPAFDQPGLLSVLHSLDDEGIDSLDFGVIGFDADTIVRRYGAYESRASGLKRNQVLGYPLFALVAPCMNNFLVAQRFEDAAAGAAELDVSIGYTLSGRMRPTKALLRLLASPALPIRYVLVRRSTVE